MLKQAEIVNFLAEDKLLLSVKAVLLQSRLGPQSSGTTCNPCRFFWKMLKWHSNVMNKMFDNSVRLIWKCVEKSTLARSISSNFRYLRFHVTIHREELEISSDFVMD